MNLVSFRYGADFDKIAAVQNVYRLESELLKMPQADIKTVHTFLPGIYERSITIPPWTVLSGAVHKTPYRVRLEKGTIAVNTDDGVKVLTAPCEFAAPAGVKRVGRVFAEEVIWTDIYPNPDNCTDLDVIVDRLYTTKNADLGDNRPAGKPLDIPFYGRHKYIQSVAAVPLSISRDKEDYRLFLAQLGISAKTVSKIAHIDADLIPMPEGFDVEVRESPIHGNGLFATRAFGAGDVICPGRISGKRTPAGRYTNHSSAPNATTIKTGDDLAAMAIRSIRPGEEITIDYRTSMRVNFGITVEGEKLCQVG